MSEKSNTAEMPQNMDSEVTEIEIMPANTDTGDSDDPLARLTALETEINALKDKALRAMAEAENTRRRAAREREEAVKFGTAEMAREMLAVADNFTLALNALPPEAREKMDDGVKSLFVGIEATERQLQQVLERFGVRRFESKDQIFDPNKHEVMMEIENSGRSAGTIVQVMQAGYMVHDRLLRPARVAVAKGDVGNTKVDTSA